MKAYLAAAIAVLVAGCATSGSQDTAERRIAAILSGDALLFVEYDADNNRATTEAEFQAGLAAAFSEADTDGSGSLSPLEWQSWSRAAMGADVIGPYRLDLDRNVDNQITRDEFVNEFSARFSAYDADSNAAVTRVELVREIPRPGAARPAERPRPRPTGGA